MQLSNLLGAGVLLAAVGFSMYSEDTNLHRTAVVASHPSGSDSTTSATLPTHPATILAAPPKPAAKGHYVLVLEGDRNGLAVTFASKKQDPWAGVPKGFASNWSVSIRDAEGHELAAVPLDVSPFATDARSLGQPVKVQGCIVVDSRIGMLLNVPAFAEAASYVFSRTDNTGVVTALGTTTAAQVRDFAGGGR